MADPVGWGIKVAGWFISPIMSRLLNKGFSYLGFCSSDKLKKLEGKVIQLKLMLEAAEASPCSDRLEPWMKELKSAFYEAQDILDSIDYNHLKSRILSQTDDKSGITCSRCTTKQVVGIMTNLKVSIVSRMELKATLDTIVKLIDEGHKLLSVLKLPAISDNINLCNSVRSPTKTTSASPIVFGRDGDVEMIRKMLRDTPAADEPSSSRTRSYSVIGIHGIAGSGKTTLAQYVCEKERDDAYFSLVMWIHVSQNFSVDAVFAEMLEIASGEKRDQLTNLDMLQRELEAKLRGKRFFLVLDDVWHDKGVSEQQFDLLLSPLKVGKRGSRVLVTTRTADTAKALGAHQNLIPIPDLDEDQYLSMFMHYALDSAMISDQALLREHELIGRKIAGKLRRSPLAARTVAGQLNRRLDIEFWRSTLTRDSLNATMGALWWSYQQLEDHVRQCFTYCSIFPKRYKLQRKELVHMWMAQGFVETTNGTGDMEEVGDDYFHVLLSSSFIQQKQDNASGKAEYFTIHDLLHDLAERVAGADCFRIEKGMAVAQIPQDVRHLFIGVFNEQVLKLDNLRSLVMSHSGDKMTEEDFKVILMNLKKLRVVRVRLHSLRQIPACVGELKHLRYLGLWGAPFPDITLPQTFTKLYHLQKFSASRITNLHCFSHEKMADLVNLQYIQCRSLNFPEVGRLKWLRTLDTFTVRKTRGYGIEQLEHLDNLRGTLHIDGLGNVERKEDACQAKLANKVHLSCLLLSWDTDESCYLQEEIIEALLPPFLITSLHIINYGGYTYPSWLSGESAALENLRYLCFSGCKGSNHPPKISEFFVHLQTLEIINCSWNSLPENLERLTSLEELIVQNCRNILSVPKLPRSLKKFTRDFIQRPLN